MKYHLKRELQIGRSKLCGFTDVYLQNKFLYQEDFHLIEPFKTFNFFSSNRARSLIVKVLLHPRTFKVDCDLCNGSFNYIFHHFVYDCTNLKTQRQTLRNKLKFYNLPRDSILNKEKFLTTCFMKPIWTKCLYDFLEEAHFQILCDYIKYGSSRNANQIFFFQMEDEKEQSFSLFVVIIQVCFI